MTGVGLSGAVVFDANFELRLIQLLAGVTHLIKGRCRITMSITRLHGFTITRFNNLVSKNSMTKIIKLFIYFAALKPTFYFQVA